ncbi:MAG: hypothetical protein QXW47_03815 [Candidatus Jordarchaeales archaeon]|nr:hypothetical protein [Candidatus Jordarchaeia archaeon]
MSGLLTLGIAVLVSFLIACAIYLTGRLIGAKGEKTPGKLDPYACGEDYPPEKFQYRVHLVYYAIFFTLLETAGVIVFTSSFSDPLYALIYMVFLVVAALLVLYRR